MPFVKGKSGNPGGKAKGAWSLTRAVKAHVEAHPEDAQAIVAKVIEDAKNGDVAARKMLWDRIDGAVPQRVNVSQLTDEQLFALAAGGHIGGDAETGTEAPE